VQFSKQNQTLNLEMQYKLFNNITKRDNLASEEDRSKSTEKRLEQEQKITAETQRSLAVAEMKKAHKLIEDAEKLRKIPAVKSISKRIQTHLALLGNGYMSMFGSEPFASKPILAENVLYNIEIAYKTYQSIRFDFQKTLEIKDEDMEKLFPTIILRTDSGYWVSTCLRNAHNQLQQIDDYCHRILCDCKE
jgi:hypothetical protein